MNGKHAKARKRSRVEEEKNLEGVTRRKGRRERGEREREHVPLCWELKAPGVCLFPAVNWLWVKSRPTKAPVTVGHAGPWPHACREAGALTLAARDTCCHRGWDH